MKAKRLSEITITLWRQRIDWPSWNPNENRFSRYVYLYMGVKL